MVAVLSYGILSNAVYRDDLAAGSRVEGWTVARFLAGRGAGLQAAVFTTGRTTVVAFKGTSPNASDILADLRLGVGMNTAYFSEAEQFVQDHANLADLVVTGHSLGGAIAQVVGNRRRIPFVTFNAPGVALLATRNLHTVSPTLGAARLAGGVIGAFLNPMQTARDIGSAFHVSRGVNYRLSGDLVSRYGLHYGQIVNLEGRGDVLDQHRMTTMIETLERQGYRNIEFPA
jgi:pimeloyl-ACP methyl ester carboxylesterase